MGAIHWLPNSWKKGMEKKDGLKLLWWRIQIKYSGLQSTLKIAWGQSRTQQEDWEFHIWGYIHIQNYFQTIVSPLEDNGDMFADQVYKIISVKMVGLLVQKALWLLSSTDWLPFFDALILKFRTFTNSYGARNNTQDLC